METQNPQYSIIIPVYNEQDSLEQLHQEIQEAMEQVSSDYEILFIDDGSSDSSLIKLQEIGQQDTRVRLISLARNYGKSAVYTAAFQRSRGNFLITLDADLQDTPSEIPKLLAKMEEGFDLVIGWKQNRFQNEPSKTVPSKVYNYLKKLLFQLELHDSNCGFRVMRRRVALGIKLYGDRYRFIPELAFLAGFRVAEVPVEHRQRKYGKSKYGPSRFWTGMLDLVSVRFLSSYQLKPLHFFGSLSLLAIVLGGALEFYVLIQKLQGSTFQVHVAAIIIGAMLIMVGFQLLGIGLIGEMMSAQNKEEGFTIHAISHPYSEHQEESG